jgi:hypothetical protein
VITRAAPEPYDNMPRVPMGTVDAVLMVDQGDFYSEWVWPHQGEWMRIRARGLTRDEVFLLASAVSVSEGDPVPMIAVPQGFSEVARGEMIQASREVAYQTGGTGSLSGVRISTSRFNVATVRRAIESPVTDVRDITIDGQARTARIVRARETAFSSELWFRDGDNVVNVTAGTFSGDTGSLLEVAKTLRFVSVDEWLSLSPFARQSLSPYAESVSSFTCEDGGLGARNEATGGQTCFDDGDGLLGSLPAGTRRTAWFIRVPKADAYELLGGRGITVSIPELTDAGSTPGIAIEFEKLATESSRVVIVVYAPNGSQPRPLSIESRSGTQATLSAFDITTVDAPVQFRIREVPCEGGWTVENDQASPARLMTDTGLVCVADEGPGGFVGTIAEPDGKVTYVFWTPTELGAGGGPSISFDQPNVAEPYGGVYGGDEKMIGAFTIDPGERQSKVTVTFRIDGPRGSREVAYTTTALVK